MPNPKCNIVINITGEFNDDLKERLREKMFELGFENNLPGRSNERFATLGFSFMGKSVAIWKRGVGE